MAITIPGLDNIQKRFPRIGEAFTAVQTYVAKNVATVTGNRMAPPPAVLGGVTPAQAPATTPQPTIQPPPSSASGDTNSGGIGGGTEPKGNLPS